VKINLRIVSIAAAFLALILAIVMVASISSANADTVRFESLITATTQNSVGVNVRIIGSHAKRHQTERIRDVLSRTIREKISGVKYRDIPKKAKLMFRKELETAEDNGVIIDSLYIYVPEPV